MYPGHGMRLEGKGRGGRQSNVHICPDLVCLHLGRHWEGGTYTRTRSWRFLSLCPSDRLSIPLDRLTEVNFLLIRAVVALGELSFDKHAPTEIVYCSPTLSGPINRTGRALHGGHKTRKVQKWSIFFIYLERTDRARIIKINLKKKKSPVTCIVACRTSRSHD